MSDEGFERARIGSVEELEELLSRPSSSVIEAMGQLEGDLLILGVGGKMGPSLARMAKRALEAKGASSRVIGVSRFSSPGLREELERNDIETIAADLLDSDALAALPECRNVIFMAGRKFGTSAGEALTWAENCYVPGLIANRFSPSRLLAFSTGNVYPMVPPSSGGARESDELAPLGEYAQSCLSRERVFEYFSRERGMPLVIIRLNYAIEMRYSVLLDLAEQVSGGQPIDVTMGFVNVIWQGDANAYILQALGLAASPPLVLNVAGPDMLSVRSLALRLGELLDKEVRIVGEEAPTAFLNNPARCIELFGPPQVSVEQMLLWVARWVQQRGPTLGKPTHFQVRSGKF